MSNLDTFSEVSSIGQLHEFDLINAHVSQIDTNTVNLRLPDDRECDIPIEEFFNDKGQLDVKADDRVTLVKEKNSTNEHCRFSFKKAQQLQGLLQLRNSWSTGSTVTGVVECPVDGGFRVLVNGVGVFLPMKNTNNDLSETPISEIVGHVGKFRVTGFKPDINAITLSLIVFKHSTSHRNISALTSVYSKGCIAEGIVTQIVRYGAFVDVNGVACLLHLSDIAWEKVEDIHLYLSKGDRISVKILKIDPRTKRINVGLKQLTTDKNPWNFLQKKYPKGKRITRKIIGVTDYGFFVEIEPRIQGLVHISEISWGKRYTDALHLFHVGDVVEVMIINVDIQAERIALSYKRCLPNPWFSFAQHHHVHEILAVTIRTISAKGIFVDLGSGIDGRIGLDDLPIGKTKDDIFAEYGVGAQINAQVLFIDPINERIRLSMNLKGIKK